MSECPCLVCVAAAAPLPSALLSLFILGACEQGQHVASAPAVVYTRRQCVVSLRVVSFDTWRLR